MFDKALKNQTRIECGLNLSACVAYDLGSISLDLQTYDHSIMPYTTLAWVYNKLRPLLAAIRILRAFSLIKPSASC